MGAEVTVLVLGDSGTGKTSLLNRRVTGRFAYDQEGRRSMMNFSSWKQRSPDNDAVVTVKTWEMPATEAFVGYASSLVNGMDAVLLLFDVTKSEKTLGYLIQRISQDTQLQNLATGGQPFAFIAACKCDAFDDEFDGQQQPLLPKELDFLSCRLSSAKSGVGVVAVFDDIVSTVLKSRELLQEQEKAQRNIDIRVRDETPAARSSVSFMAKISTSLRRELSRRLSRVES